MRTLSVRVLVTPPVPRHSGHFSSTIVPTPWHSRHGSEKLNEPWLRVTSPTPRHCGQVRGSVPGLAPVPWQVSQTPGARSVSGSVAPAHRVARSRASPRPRRRGRAPARARPAPAAAAGEDRAEQVGEAGAAEAPVAGAVPAPARRRTGRTRSNGRRRRRPGRCAGTRPSRTASASRRTPCACRSSESTSYASETALNRSSASVLPGLWSGCSSRASLRYAFLISSAEADLGTPEDGVEVLLQPVLGTHPVHLLRRGRRRCGIARLLTPDRRPRPAPAAAAARRAGSRGASPRRRSAR